MNSGVQRPLEILWRGPLDSCNYSCDYCPFAKRAATKKVLEQDQRSLARFVDWVKTETRYALRILFTPYGEALIWPSYRQALVDLSHIPHVEQVSIQTNGSGPMDFLSAANLAKVSLWISWHPTEIQQIPFAEKICALHAQGVSLSVGAVAIPQHVEPIEALRNQIPSSIPMWLNAQKPGVRYSEKELQRFCAIDPDFDVDRRRHRSLGKECSTGYDSISVDGDGEITRCHFAPTRLGNLYSDDLSTLLSPRPCPRRTCDCWIGYVHLTELGLADRFPRPRRLARIRVPQQRDC